MSNQHLLQQAIYFGLGWTVKSDSLLALLHTPPPQKQQAGSGVDRQAGAGGAQQALTVMVQGQGQTTGQLQVIPHGVTVIPGPGQQLMQAALPNGQVQRFLFTPLASAATPTSGTGMMRYKRVSIDELFLYSFHEGILVDLALSAIVF